MITPGVLLDWLNLGKIFVRIFNPKQWLLIVEDSADDIEILAIFLRQRKKHYDVAKTAEEGLAKLRSRKYRYVFLDLRLPGMDGWSLLRHIIDEFPDTKVIITCGEAFDLNEMPKGLPFTVMLKPPTLHGLDQLL